MARLIATLLVLTLVPLAAGAQAAEPSGTLLRADEKPRPARSFDIVDQTSDGNAAKAWGSRIFAGRQLMPNGVIGVGMFGPKAEKGPHSAATARDLSVRKQRKAAVGFSLKF